VAWCENPNCGKTGLRKADVEFDDDSRLVLCHGCMTVVHPGWVPPEEFVDLTGVIPRVVRTESSFGMAIQVNDEDGIKAAFSYGGISLAIHVPNEDLKRLLES
jgi:hypothetical protein